MKFKLFSLHLPLMSYLSSRIVLETEVFWYLHHS